MSHDRQHVSKGGGSQTRPMPELPHVSNVHDLHVWTITSGFVALSTHLTCVNPDNRDLVLRSAQDLLAKRFGIRHSTIQLDRDPSCGRTAHTTA